MKATTKWLLLHDMARSMWAEGRSSSPIPPMAITLMPLSIFAAPAVRSWAAAGVGGGNVGLGRARAVGWGLLLQMQEGWL